MAQVSPSYYVSIDPGTKNFGIAVLSIETNGQIKVIYNETVSLMDESRINVLSISIALSDARIAIPQEHRGQETWVIEYQPPINGFQNPGLIRKNSYVEGAVNMWICENRVQFHETVAPSAVKRHFKFPPAERGTQYRANKQRAVQLVKGILTPEQFDDIDLDEHGCDCVLNALYVHQKKSYECQ
jgi:Holliday junction resolvasome RuvABC endonuclease subunit